MSSYIIDLGLPPVVHFRGGLVIYKRKYIYQCSPKIEYLKYEYNNCQKYNWRDGELKPDRRRNRRNANNYTNHPT